MDHPLYTEICNYALANRIAAEQLAGLERSALQTHLPTDWSGESDNYFANLQLQAARDLLTVEMQTLSTFIDNFLNGRLSVEQQLAFVAANNGYAIEVFETAGKICIQIWPKGKPSVEVSL